MGGACEVLRAEIIDCVRLLGSRATEEGRAVDHGIDAAHRGGEGIGIQQIADRELDRRFAGARGIADEGADVLDAVRRVVRASLAGAGA